MATVRTIPAHYPFLDSLVAELLTWDRHRLASARLLMPSRRACVEVRDAFLRLGGGEPLLLPRLVPIGEPDEAELLLDPDLALELPPAIAPLRRRLLLMRLVLSRDHEMKHEQAIRLAGALESFLDELHNEEVDQAALDDLAPANLAEHWQETLVFLRLLRDAWPLILAEEGVVDAALRRRLLLDRMAASWRRRPPAEPVLAAGLTGTIPAIARLLAVVARLPQGTVVLPGLDQGLDEEAWKVLGPSHPQSALRHLLEVIGIDRAAVRPWPARVEAATHPARAALWREVLRPAATTDVWRREISLPPAAFDGLEVCEAPDLAAEAVHLALRMREALETPGRRAVLVTPNRYLGRRVAAELLRWHLRVDDSAGTPLDQSPPGVFLLLIAHLVAEEAPPVTLLAALKHPLAAGGLGQRDFRRYVRALERGLLRGPRLAGGLDGLVAALAARETEAPWPAPVPPEELGEWLVGLAVAARPLAALMALPEASLVDLLDAHLALAEWLAADAAGDAGELWAKEAGHCAFAFVSELRQAAARDLPPVPSSAYPAMLAVLMGSQSVRRTQGGHPRLAILGQLESRLLQADLVLVAGLCDGVWPAVADCGPWLNRPMRQKLGLPPVEQGIGIAAHDFMTAACAPAVVLSQAAKDERGTPTTHSRWLTRLGAVLKAANLGTPTAGDPCWTRWTAALDDPGGRPRPVARPEPRPPVAARPRELWATDIEKLMRDPYSVYAKRVLKLKPLEELDADPGLAERGQMIHAALEEFVRTWPGELPEDPCSALLAIGLRHFARQAHRPQVAAMWWPRFERIVEWFCEHEMGRRRDIARIAMETRGACELQAPGGPFTVKARADRVEVRSDGSLAIVDYKTGGLPNGREVRLGFAPQLLIEGLIAAEGGFDRVAPGEPALLLFWQLRGGEPAGSECSAIGQGEDLAALLAVAREGLARLIAHFDDPSTPYLPVPRPEVAPIFGDYEHLARLGEWWGTERPA